MQDDNQLAAANPIIDQVHITAVFMLLVAISLLA
jgi:hypothetical protein